MSGTHGDLYSEIGKLVLAAHAGQSLDLIGKSEELAHRYWELGVPAETLAKVIARSLGAIGVSMELVSHGGSRADAEPVRTEGAADRPNGSEPIRLNGGSKEASREERGGAPTPRSASRLFPSGVRISLLS
jgi:hypothetical protein